MKTDLPFRRSNFRLFAAIASVVTIAILIAPALASVARGEEPVNLDSLVGQSVDIAPSAYQYRADGEADQNPPESWLAVLHYANLPLNKPFDVNNPGVKRVLSGLLWEEIRPVWRLELSWPADARHRPSPEQLSITTLTRQGNSSSWWNNTGTQQFAGKPKISADKLTYSFDLNADTCGIVVALADGKEASQFDGPTVRVLVHDVWKKMDVEVEWAYDKAKAAGNYSGHADAYDGRLADFHPLDGDGSTKITGDHGWQSHGASTSRRGIHFSLLYMGTSHWRKTMPFTSQRDDVARTIVTIWTKSGSFSFLASDLERGPILAPEYGFFVRRTSALPSRSTASSNGEQWSPPIDLASSATSARQFIDELHRKNLQTIREKVDVHAEQTWHGAVAAMHPGNKLPAIPSPPPGFEPPMQVHVPSEQLTAQWNLGNWHLLRHAQKNPKTGRLWFDDYPYGILAEETHLILAALDMIGSHRAAADGFDQWLSLPMDIDPRSFPGEALPDRPTGLFSDGHGALTHAVGPASVGGQMDGVHAYGPGAIGCSLAEHYRLTGDTGWLERSAARMKANADWMLRQRRLLASILPNGERLWCKGLQPPLQVTPDSGGLWMQFYEAEGYYSASVSRLAAAMGQIDPAAGAKLRDEADAYKMDLRRAVERSIALSPVVPVRDGTYHSVIPPACYIRGPATGAWGWLRDGSAWHVGPMYWDTVQTAAPLICIAKILSPHDVRVQGYLDVLEDRFLLENPYAQQRDHGDWFSAGWQYQMGLERTANMHLLADEIPAFLRSFLNGYAVDIVPDGAYVFNEHAVHGPPDKIFEEAAFLERFRDMLVMEDGQNLWLARATPRAWLSQGKQISVKHAPTHFGDVSYEITSSADSGKISAVVDLPKRDPPREVWLRLRHPTAAKINSVTVNGKPWTDFDPAKEVVRLHGVGNRATVSVRY